MGELTRKTVLIRAATYNQSGSNNKNKNKNKPKINPHNVKVQDRKAFAGRPDLLIAALSNLLVIGNFVLVYTSPRVELVRHIL